MADTDNTQAHSNFRFPLMVAGIVFVINGFLADWFIDSGVSDGGGGGSTGYAEKLGMGFVDADYDSDNWFERVRGLEMEPERGARCTVCFDMRFERTALYAAENGYNLISSTLGISRWKNMDQINASGTRAAARWNDMHYWTFNWRKQGGAARMVELSKREEFYQQEYCGCVYSLRDTNDWRLENGREKIERGVKFYGKNGVE